MLYINSYLNRSKPRVKSNKGLYSHVNASFHFADIYFVLSLSYNYYHTEVLVNCHLSHKISKYLNFILLLPNIINYKPFGLHQPSRGNLYLSFHINQFKIYVNPKLNRLSIISCLQYITGHLG